VESSAIIGNWNDFDKIQITILKSTKVAKAFYSSNPQLHSTIISWENFKAKLLHRFRDVRSDQYHFMQFQSATQQKDEAPREFLDRFHSLAMKTVPKVEDSLLQKFHYDQAQRMLLSTFIAGLSGNPEKWARFQMPATVDRALQIAITVFEAEAEEKRNSAFFFFFSNSKTHRKGGGNFGQPWKTFGRSDYAQAARISTDAPHVGRKQRQQNERPTNSSSVGKLLCFKCGKPGLFPKNAFQINFTPERTRVRVSTPNHRKLETKAVLMPKLLVETHIVRKTCS